MSAEEVGAWGLRLTWALSARTQIEFSYVAVLVPLSSCIAGQFCLVNKIVGTGAEKVASKYLRFIF